MTQRKFAFPATIFLIMIFIVASCDNLIPANNQKKISLSSDEILNTDMAFSTMSRQVGMKKAFLEYIGNEGVLLRPGHPPLSGADAIDFLSQLNDTAYTLTWKPSRGEISQSGDIGYTYGIYELNTKDTVYKGTYVSIWKKQNDGSWKLALESGNEGIQDSLH
ncbi:MAG: nuclear transport factor 2 family protein [Ginsengibacter sp.]